MMKDKHPCEKTEKETRKPIGHHSHSEDDNEVQIERYKSVMIVLETNPFTRPEVRYFGRVHRGSLEEEPAHMSVEESFFDIIGIFITVSFCMMNAVIIGPSSRRSSESETSQDEVDYFDNWVCSVGLVSEESMISSRDSKTCQYIEENSDKKRYPTKRTRQEVKWRENDEENMVDRHEEDTTPVKFPGERSHDRIICPSPRTSKEKA